MGLGQKEILIVDDDADMRRMLRKVLEAAGMKVTSAETIKEAIASTRSRMPHLVMLDLNLPTESGFDYLEQRRKDAALGLVPVLVLSGLADRASIYRAMSLGATDYSAKPLNAALLLQKIRKLFASDTSALKVSFEGAAQRPNLKARIPSKIRSASEGGFLLKTPVKVMGHPMLFVRASLLDRFGTSALAAQPTSRQPFPSPGAPGQYEMELAYMGLTDELIQKMRLIIREWK